MSRRLEALGLRSWASAASSAAGTTPCWGAGGRRSVRFGPQLGNFKPAGTGDFETGLDTNGAPIPEPSAIQSGLGALRRLNLLRRRRRLSPRKASFVTDAPSPIESGEMGDRVVCDCVHLDAS